MELKEYFQEVDRIILSDVRKLAEELFSFACVLIIVPMHVVLLLFRIMIPWLIPFTTKEEA